MPTYHDVQFDLMGRIPSVKADAELTMLTLALKDEIALASRPGTLAPFYRPATTLAVAHARQAYRHVMALVAREDLRRMVAQSAKQPRERYTGTEPSYVGGRAWTGD